MCKELWENKDDRHESHFQGAFNLKGEIWNIHKQHITESEECCDRYTEFKVNWKGSFQTDSWIHIYRQGGILT